MSEFASKIFLTRPISAKNKKKHLLYSPAVSCARLRKIQKLLKKEDSSNCPSNIDGILCIAGIDSRYHNGSKQLLNYLLFGYCNLLADSIGPRVSDEALEDVVVFIKAESVHVYCNPVNYPILLPFIGHWRNLHIHCLNSDKYEENEEESEEFKITSFISMIKGSSVVGIPNGNVNSACTEKPNYKPLDPFTLEKWPLIQSFALEDFGGGGFFTMKHEVVDVSQDLCEIYGLLDPVTVESLVTEILPLFEHQCKSVLTNVDVESSCCEVACLTEKQIGEPIISYYAHGHFSDGKDKAHCGSSPAAGFPCLLIGTNTSRKYLEKARQTSGYNGSVAVGNSGLNGSPAKHMVCFAVEPRGIITCARTYFFQTGFLPHPVTKITNVEVPNEYSPDRRLLVDLYCSMIDAVLEGIRTYIHTLSIQQSQSTVLKVMKLGAEKRSIKLGSSFWSTNVEFTLKARDLLGRAVSLVSDTPVAVIKSAFLYLYDVPSVEHPGKCLGSVAFGESFVDSAVRLLQPDSKATLNACHLILTENVPRFVSWLGSERESAASKELDEFVKSKDESGFGTLLVSGDQVFLASLNLFSKWEKGTLFVYQRGILFRHARLGTLVFPMSELKQIQFYDQDSPSSVALLILTHSPSLKKHLPSYLTTDTNNLVLALTPKTKIFRQFYSEVLHSWKGSDMEGLPPFQVICDLPDNISKWYSCLQEWITLGPQTLGYDLQSAKVVLSSFKEYIDHLSLSSVSDKPVKSADLPLLLGSQPSDTPGPHNSELLLTIITGVPGSGKDSLCAALMVLAKENSRWLVLRKPVDLSGPFDSTKFIQDSLSTTSASQRRLQARRSANKMQRLRVLLVTPGFTDIVDVVQAITNHPDPDICRSVKIGAVSCCVDPRNMFMEHRLALPKLLDQCAQGWVNNVVFTSCLEPQDEQLAFVQKLVRVCNPQAAFILAKGGEVTRTPDVHLILSDTAFMEHSMVQRRHLTCPGWALDSFSPGPADPAVCVVRLTFYKTLEKVRFVTRLRALQGPITGIRRRETGAVHSLEGHVRFSGESALNEVTWTSLNGVLRSTRIESTIVPRPPGSHPSQNGPSHNVPTFFVTFTGFSLKENYLKDWLRSCCKPKPQLKMIKTRKDMSKKEVADYNSKHSLEPLPDGWFYTGMNYVSMEGEKTQHHPLLEEFLEEHLGQLNEEARQHNAQIDAIPIVDLFEKPNTV